MREYALIGEYDTQKSWGMDLYDVDIGLPTVKTQYLELPLESTDIDLSEVVTGRPSYGTREIKLYLGKKDMAPIFWTETVSQIASAVHGKRLPIILSFDSEFYYMGRITCETDKISFRRSIYPITAVCDPYKYRRKITERTLVLDGEKTITLHNMDMITSPYFTVSKDITVSCNGEGTYNVFAGTDRNVPEILLLPGANSMTLTGSGTVEIRYQEGKM